MDSISKMLIVMVLTGMLFVSACGDDSSEKVITKKTTTDKKVDADSVDERLDDVKTDFNNTYCTFNIKNLNTALNGEKEYINDIEDTLLSLDAELIIAESEDDKISQESLNMKISELENNKVNSQNTIMDIEKDINDLSDKCSKLEKNDKTVCLEFKAESQALVDQYNDDVIDIDGIIISARDRMSNASGGKLSDLQRIIETKTEAKEKIQRDLTRAEIMLEELNAIC